MKHLSEYILEANNGPSVGELMVNILKGTSTSKDTICDYLSNLDMRSLKSMSDYMNANDNANYIAYCPMDDEFLSDGNKEAIVDKMSQYFQKHVCK